MTAAGTAPPGRLAEVGRFLEIQNLGLNLPFGLAFLLAAAHGLPTLRTFVLVVVALVAARTAGHAFNRWADRAFDAANPRTRDRALVAGRLSPGFGLALTAASSVVLVVAAGLLNPLALALSPVALLLVLGYSYTKRFTAWTTVLLGLVEAIIPAGAFIAVTGTLPLAGWLAVGGVLAWGTAFETVHSLGDRESDRALGLRSMPLRLGVPRSLALVAAAHAASMALWVAFGLALRFALPYWVALAAMAALLVYTDLTLPRHLDAVRVPFQRHFLLAGLFLAGVVLALALPAVPV